MALEIRLPSHAGTTETYRLSGATPHPDRAEPSRARVAYAAAHVVADALADRDPVDDAALDWDRTLDYRRYLWGLGLGVAEAMDTAQRGMGLRWAPTRELICRSGEEARSAGGAIVCGVGTDQLPAGPGVGLAEVVAAYEEQLEVVEAAGVPGVLMASRALAACARGPEDYAAVYERVLSQVSQPVILHWLGEMFDPALAGYWGSSDLDAATDVCLDVLAAHSDRVQGIKVSLLDRDREADLRRRVPAGVRVFTGDDFNFLELIKGDGRHHSDALLGIFDACAPAAAAALAALDEADLATYEEVLSPVVPLSRHVFGPPTRYYKTGIVFLAYLNGHQPHFRMVGGLESARSAHHLGQLFVLADRARLLRDPELAAARMRSVMAVAGVS